MKFFFLRCADCQKSINIVDLEQLTTAEVPPRIVHWIFRTIRSLLVVNVALKSWLCSASLSESSMGSGSFFMIFFDFVPAVAELRAEGGMVTGDD